MIPGDKDDFSLDRFKLEIEAERNAELMRKYGKKLGVASASTKDAKRELDYLETELAEVIRSNYKSYGMDKPPTDKVAFGLAKGEDKYKKQFKIYLMALRYEEDLKNAVDTCRQRGMMLRLLTELWLNQYYGETNRGISIKPKRQLLNKRIKNLNDFDEKEDNYELTNYPIVDPNDDIPY